jgi:hypothetical protein
MLALIPSNCHSRNQVTAPLSTEEINKEGAMNEDMFN